jgi:hypothetical protein
MEQRKVIEQKKNPICVTQHKKKTTNQTLIKCSNVNFFRIQTSEDERITTPNTGGATP